MAVAEEITFQNDDQAYQEHQNGDFVNDVHGLQIEAFRPIRVFTSEKVASYLSEAKNSRNQFFFFPVVPYTRIFR